METITLKQYADQIGAELKPACLCDMPIMSKEDSDGKSYFGGIGWVTEWLQVKDPSGGVNKSGEWPFSVQKCSHDGTLTICASGY